MAIIINNKEFTFRMYNRDGTDKDAERLCKLFKWLGFLTKRYDNLTGKEMRSRLQVREDESGKRMQPETVTSIGSTSVVEVLSSLLSVAPLTIIIVRGAH